MSPVEVASILFGTFGVLVLMRIPVAFALGATGAIVSVLLGLASALGFMRRRTCGRIASNITR